MPAGLIRASIVKSWIEQKKGWICDEGTPSNIWGREALRILVHGPDMDTMFRKIYFPEVPMEKGWTWVQKLEWDFACLPKEERSAATYFNKNDLSHQDYILGFFLRKGGASKVLATHWALLRSRSQFHYQPEKNCQVTELLTCFLPLTLEDSGSSYHTNLVDLNYTQLVTLWTKKSSSEMDHTNIDGILNSFRLSGEMLALISV